MLHVRAAAAADVDAIFTLIGELADFERLREQMTGRREDLLRHLFGEPRCAEALVAEWQGATVGFALYFFSFSTFLCRPGLYLEDLYVRETHRGRGIGLALLQAVQARALERGCGRIEWAVLDWNQRAIEFYRRFGARALEGWSVYRKGLAPPTTG